MTGTKAKPLLLCWGVCQSRMIGRLIAEIPYIGKRLDVHIIDSFAHPVTGVYEVPDPALLDRCEYLWYQHAVSGLLPDYIQKLTDEGKAVRFPFVFCQPLWPQHNPALRHPLEPEMPFGRYPYGDRALLHLLESITDDEKVVEEYMKMDVAAEFSVDRLIENWEYQLAEFDEGCDVKLSDYLRLHWRSKRLFWTLHHPSNEVFAFTLGHLIARTFGAAVPTSEICEALLKHELNDLMTPIHPSVARAIGLEWFSDDLLYRHQSEGLLSIEEWALRYVRHSRQVLAYRR